MNRIIRKMNCSIALWVVQGPVDWRCASIICIFVSLTLLFRYLHKLFSQIDKCPPKQLFLFKFTVFAVYYLQSANANHVYTEAQSIFPSIPLPGNNVGHYIEYVVDLKIFC